MISLFNSINTEKEESNIRLFDSYQDFLAADPVPELEEAPESGEEKEDEAESWGALFNMEYQRKIQQAEDLLNAAREEAEVIRGEAFEKGEKEGYDAGYEAGRQQAYDDSMATYDKELNSRKQEIVTLVQDMGNKKDKVLEKYIDDLKDISLAVAEKIIHTSLKSSSEIIKRMIISSTEKLKKTSWVKIYIGKEEPGINIQGDAELIHELSKLSENVKIVVMEEESGTCIVELPNEIIDVSAGTQLENIRGILENARL